MDKNDYDIRVDYDDQPNDVTDKFISALEKHGIIVENVTAEDSSEPYMYYKIKKT